MIIFSVLIGNNIASVWRYNNFLIRSQTVRGPYEKVINKIRQFTSNNKMCSIQIWAFSSDFATHCMNYTGIWNERTGRTHCANIQVIVHICLPMGKSPFIFKYLWKTHIVWVLSTLYYRPRKLAQSNVKKSKKYDKLAIVNGNAIQIDDNEIGNIRRMTNKGWQRRTKIEHTGSMQLITETENGNWIYGRSKSSRLFVLFSCHWYSHTSRWSTQKKNIPKQRTQSIMMFGKWTFYGD